MANPNTAGCFCFYADYACTVKRIKAEEVKNEEESVRNNERDHRVSPDGQFPIVKDPVAIFVMVPSATNITDFTTKIWSRRIYKTRAETKCERS